MWGCCVVSGTTPPRANDKLCSGLQPVSHVSFTRLSTAPLSFLHSRARDAHRFVAQTLLYTDFFSCYFVSQCNGEESMRYAPYFLDRAQKYVGCGPSGCARPTEDDNESTDATESAESNFLLLEEEKEEAAGTTDDGERGTSDGHAASTSIGPASVEIPCMQLV